MAGRGNRRCKNVKKTALEYKKLQREVFMLVAALVLTAIVSASVAIAMYCLDVFSGSAMPFVVPVLVALVGSILITSRIFEWMAKKDKLDAIAANSGITKDEIRRG